MNRICTSEQDLLQSCIFIRAQSNARTQKQQKQQNFNNYVSLLLFVTYCDTHGRKLCVNLVESPFVRVSVVCVYTPECYFDS